MKEGVVTKLKPLLRWRPTANSLDMYRIGVLLDFQDRDVDPETEEPHPRILGFRVINRGDRAAEFVWGAHDNPFAMPRYLLGRHNYFIPVLGRRVTDRDFFWHFTPEHRQVFPGSVSSPSLLTSGGSATAGQTSNTTAAFTPTANALLGASWGTGGAALQTHTFTNDHVGSGTWTNVTVGHITGRHTQGYSQVGASPGSGTITNTYSGSQTVKAWIIWEVAGHNTAAPVANSATASGVNDTLTVTLTAADAGNLTIASVSSSTNVAAIGVGANYTELGEAVSSGSNDERCQVQYGTAADPSWSTLGTVSNRAAAVTYAQALAAAGAPPLAALRAQRTSLLGVRGVRAL